MTRCLEVSNAGGLRESRRFSGDDLAGDHAQRVLLHDPGDPGGVILVVHGRLTYA